MCRAVGTRRPPTHLNTGIAALEGVELRLGSSAVDDWRASAAKKAGANMAVEGGLVLWSVVWVTVE